jgi:hypothetical protein
MVIELSKLFGHSNCFHVNAKAEVFIITIQSLHKNIMLIVP